MKLRWLARCQLAALLLAALLLAGCAPDDDAGTVPASVPADAESAPANNPYDY